MDELCPKCRQDTLTCNWDNGPGPLWCQNCDYDAADAIRDFKNKRTELEGDVMRRAFEWYDEHRGQARVAINDTHSRLMEALRALEVHCDS